MRRIFERFAGMTVLVAFALAWAGPGAARVKEGDPEYSDFQLLQKEWQVGAFAPQPGRRVQRPAAIPDIFGPGAVLSAGNLIMKVTNYGIIGNPFTNVSSDPSGQWKGASQIEYLNYIGILVGAVNPLATEPTAQRRVSWYPEWRPPSLDPLDRMYSSYDGIKDGKRFENDDDDKDPITHEDRYDEDFLDGRDNDGDGKIDEDYGALGQQMYSCTMRDDTPQAINAAATERHVPLGIELQQSAWCYAIEGYQDFNVIQYDIYNRSGHMLDSVVIGWRTDMDCGPIKKAPYWNDDFNVPFYPQGDFLIQPLPGDMRVQPGSDRLPVPNVDPDSALCPRYKIRVQGWSCIDDDTDEGDTKGIATVMLLDHTIDPTGTNGPRRVGIRSFRSFPSGTPYAQGGVPTIDQQRFEFMVGQDNIDPLTGFINEPMGDLKGDYSDIVSIGPWPHLPDGGHLQATIAFGVVERNAKKDEKLYVGDYLSQLDADPAVNAVTNPGPLMENYPSLKNAIAAQVAFEGAYQVHAWPLLTDFHGRETAVKAPPGQILFFQNCPALEPEPRPVGDRLYSWFDFDCDYCTGAYSKASGGLFHRTWLAESPPPSPLTNVSASYNYAANPERLVPPAGDRQVTIAWDNLSETTPDPKNKQFDFRGYNVWKVSDWKRDVGSAGPSEKEWTLLGQFRLFDGPRSKCNAVRLCPPESVGTDLFHQCKAVGDTIWPSVFLPQINDTVLVKLYSGDLWDRQSGVVLRPDMALPCTPPCIPAKGDSLGFAGSEIFHMRYPVGHWRLVDNDVKNGFLYFYCVTAFDSTGRGANKFERESGRSAVEADGVVPQGMVDDTRGPAPVWVVPNPYRGERLIKNRPSSWDLTPNASDPTGTHVDFMGLPRGDWRIKIFTVSGDMVVELNAADAINESIRSAVTDAAGVARPGYNRQQDNPNDGQARWNLISRNGQDVVSGIYLFTVELGGAVKHRGKFVIIR